MNKYVFLIPLLLCFNPVFGALDFDGANDRVSNGNGVSNIDTASKTMLVWVNPTTYEINDNISTDGSALTSGNSAFSITMGASTQYRMDYRWSSATGSWLFGSVTTGSWESLSCDYDRSSDANDPNCYENGSLQSETESGTPSGTAKTGIDSISIGENVAGGGDVDAIISHVVIWDVELSSTEHLVLSRGVNPFVIQNDNLQVYYPLNGNNSPENEYAQSALGTVTGAIKATTNPPVELIENYL